MAVGSTAGRFTLGRYGPTIVSVSELMDTEPRLDSATALARSPLFASLGRLDLARLAGELEELSFRPGQAIVREGDPPDGFYVINSGRVVVMARAPLGDGSPLTVLAAGECFGEIALLRDVPRTATVTALQDSVLQTLDREDFLAAMSGDTDLLGRTESMAARRIQTV
jgi:CRP-like cAMP-binding protein